MENKVIFNEKEQLARTSAGIESDATHVVVNNEKSKDKINLEAISDYNEQCNVYKEQLDKQREALAANKFNIKNLELMPIKNNIIVSPYEVNPFQTISVTKAGLLRDSGGAKPTYRSNETGNLEQEDSGIIVATVVEVGKECEYVHVGDVVMYTKPSSVPIPFYRQGFELISEGRVMVVINENLKERFKK